MESVKLCSGSLLETKYRVSFPVKYKKFEHTNNYYNTDNFWYWDHKLQLFK